MSTDTGVDKIILRVREAKKGDREAAEQLVIENSGLIWSVARRFFGRGVDPDDLYQLGCIGFIKAIEGFDESYGTKFSTYAVPKIGGEIRRFLRDDGPIKVSRNVKELAFLVRNSRERLSQELERDPSIMEVSQDLGISIEEIASAEIAVEAPDSLHRESGEEGFTLESAIGTDGMEDKIIESVALREAIMALPERERIIILLRFFKGFTQDRTAQRLGVSQVQISRMEKKAIEKLRQLIA